MSQEPHTHHQDNSFWIGMFLGGLIGALLILVLGTERGKKLVDKLQKDGLDFLDDTKVKVSKEVAEKVDVLEQKGQELAKKGQELVKQGQTLEEELVETVTEAKADVAETVAEKVDDALAHIERLQEHGRETTAQLRKRLFKNIPPRK